MRIVGVIPSRWASTRFPGKSLADICGKPLVQWVFERASAARSLNEVVVATDDDRIAAAVAGFGGRAVMTSPDHQSGTDRVAEAVSGLDADVVINIQGDEPMIEPRLIDRVAMEMRDNASRDMATAATRIKSEIELKDPSVVKVVFGENHRALFFSRSVIPFDRDGVYNAGSGLYWRHIGIYAYRREFLVRLVGTPQCAAERAEKLEQLRALHIGAEISVVETDTTGVGVDTPRDLEKVVKLMKAGRMA